MILKVLQNTKLAFKKFAKCRVLARLQLCLRKFDIDN